MPIPSRLRLPMSGALALAAAVAIVAAGACSSSDETPTTPALPTQFSAQLNAANERPAPVNSAAVGSSTVTVNGTTVTYTVTMSGLTGAPRLSHIHGPGDATVAAGVLVNFPSITTVTTNAGTISSSFTASDIVGQNGQPPITMDSLLKLMRSGNTYVNVHTAQFGAGEIRGQLVAK